MSVLQVADIAFGFGADKLFQGVTFKIEPGERVALVAPNGAGKTTLLRILAGELHADEGSVVLARDLRIGFYRQSHEMSLTGTVLDALLGGFQEVLAIRAELAEARTRAASGAKDDLERLARVEERHHIAQGDDIERRIQLIAQRLGFDADAMSRSVRSLSGGERGRLHLGVVLAQEPDFLLLDEPTNHLDLQTIDWLEQYLIGLHAAVLAVSHDRAFLDNVCPRTLELGRRSFRVYPVPYSRYTVDREQDLERERAVAERQQAMIAKTEDFIRRNIAGQKTKQAQSRRRMIEKLERLERPDDVWEVAQHIRFRFAPAPRTGDIVLEAGGLRAERHDTTLFSGFDLLVRRGERIAVVGPNGCGKTTLLKLLAGRGSSQDEGRVRHGANLCEGFFDQDLGSLDPDKTGIDEIRSVRGDMNVDATRAYLARFRFWGDLPFQKVASLSGGERSRLALAKLLLEPRNLLFLDEPTNHLDIPAAEVLEEALVNFEGTTVFVSHDRRFLENVSTRVLAFRDGAIDDFSGSYRELVERDQRGAVVGGDGEESQEAAQVEERALEGSGERIARRASFEANKAAARTLQRKRRRLQELETRIAEGEAELSELRSKLARAPGDAWEELASLAHQEQMVQTKVESMMNEWSVLGDELTNGGGEQL